jgi:anthranilate synthase component 2
VRTLIVDHYDSFVFNLYQAIGELGGEPVVHRADRIEVDLVRALAPDRIVLSPGPGTPEDPRYSGSSIEIVRAFGSSVPILGVCFGHQAIVSAFGGRIVRAKEPMHGKRSLVRVERTHPIFRGLSGSLDVMRYHSLIADPSSLPEQLAVLARSEDDGAIMALAHRNHPIVGIQFHPESIGTPSGKQILANWLSAS